MYTYMRTVEFLSGVTSDAVPVCTVRASRDNVRHGG